MNTLVEIITLEHLTKQYNDKTILHSINQTFYTGASIAFMGHNGCGKSTLLKIIANLITPTSGKIVFHKPLLFHYVPEKFMPLPLTARTYLMRMGELDGLKKSETRDLIKTLGDDFFLSELLDTSMKYLSKGTLQKIGVIQALIKKPDILLLDEPLSGQDIESQKVFIRKINELHGQGVTIFMSCHEQMLVDAVAEDIFTIQKGRLVPYKPVFRQMYTMVFENNQALQEENIEILERMQKYGENYKIQAAEDEKDQLLFYLLQKGCILRGLYDEQVN